jgi:citrate lyase subunit alpha/citrate CoA-transferase
MKNSLNREVPYPLFNGVHPLKSQTFPITKNITDTNKLRESLQEALDELHLHDGMVVSFHHHLRNGDEILNLVMHEIAKRNIKRITLVASSIFEVHAPMVKLIEEGIITKIITAYVSGPVAQAISEGKCEDICIIHSHGYRAYMIASSKVKIDIAFIGVPCSTPCGDGGGTEGPSACGSLGYAVADAMYAQKVVVLTDYFHQPKHIQIKQAWVDLVVKVDRLGDPSGIVSGTTTITKDPVGLNIAKMTLQLMKATGLLKEGFSFQTGAGGISLALAKEVFDYCEQHHLQGSFISGGITGYQVDLLNAHHFKTIKDVQCFDLKAVASMHENPNHHMISADDYAGPTNPDNIVNQLDIVVLGATEIDLDYNVNVTTGSDGVLMGGSGGHCDTAAGAKFTIIVSKLVSSRLSVVVDKVMTITTPHESIDALVTDRGIAIHPRHQELIQFIKEHTTLPLKTIDELYEIAIKLTGKPEPVQFEDRIVALSVYRDGTNLDVIKKVVNEETG